MFVVVAGPGPDGLHPGGHPCRPPGTKSGGKLDIHASGPVRRAVPLLRPPGQRHGAGPSNFYIGVRVPWTLASERVWNDTHRLAAWLMVGCGMVGFVLVIRPADRHGDRRDDRDVVGPIVYAFVHYKRARATGGAVRTANREAPAERSCTSTTRANGLAGADRSRPSAGCSWAHRLLPHLHARQHLRRSTLRQGASRPRRAGRVLRARRLRRAPGLVARQRASPRPALPAGRADRAGHRIASGSPAAGRGTEAQVRRALWGLIPEGREACWSSHRVSSRLTRWAEAGVPTFPGLMLTRCSSRPWRC